MNTLEARMAAHGATAVEFAAWGWAATLPAELRRTVELALAAHGVDGIGDLALAGPAHGGLDAEDVAELETFLEAELGERLAA